MNKLSVSFLILLTPTFILAEEPSSGTLIMISSIGAWMLAAAAIHGIRRWHHTRQIQRDVTKSA